MTLPDLNMLPLPELYFELARSGLIARLLQLARDEDLGSGDHAGDITTACWAPPSSRLTARLATRAPGVIAGLETIPDLLGLLAPDVSCTVHHADGQPADPGRTLATFEGPAAQLLVLERTMLNLLSRLSGVATLTASFVRAMGPESRAKLFDTRKTTPGLRMLEKYAVRCGGGSCHRLGLYDAVLVKDNHVASIDPARLAEHAAASARRARSHRPLRFVEIEVDSLEQFDALLTVEPGLIDVILLDNMNPEMLRDAAARRDRQRPTLLLEASGGVNQSTIGSIARTGVDRISVGALTHSAVALDLGLDA